MWKVLVLPLHTTQTAIQVAIVQPEEKEKADLKLESINIAKNGLSLNMATSRIADPSHETSGSSTPAIAMTATYAQSTSNHPMG